MSDNINAATPNPTASTVVEQPQGSSKPVVSSIPDSFESCNPNNRLDTVDGSTLLSMDIAELGYSIDTILPHGLFVLAGSPKVGKTWLCEEIAIAVATGNSLWEYKANQGDVLYLALEDNYRRMQNRLSYLMDADAGADALARMHIALYAQTIKNGLVNQVNMFLNEHPTTQLIVVDTLQHVRDNLNDKNMYAADYTVMEQLSEIPKSHDVTLLIVTHTRKMQDADPINMITGSTGISGGCDGMWVLLRQERTGDIATLTISNRDTQAFEFELKFDSETCHWLKMTKPSQPMGKEDEMADVLIKMLSQHDNWEGTSSELSQVLGDCCPYFQISPAVLGKKIRQMANTLHRQNGIIAQTCYRGNHKIIKLRLVHQV